MQREVFCELTHVKFSRCSYTLQLMRVFYRLRRFIMCLRHTMALSLRQLPVSRSSLFKALPSSSSLSALPLSFLRQLR